MSDTHFGDKLSDGKLIMETLDHIKTTENAYCILGGDLMDTAIASSVGDTYGANLNPMEQIRTCVRLFQPLADSGKIIAVVPGNHERRVMKQDGLDMTEIMCAQLGIANRYSPTTAYVFLRFGVDRSKHPDTKQRYCIYVTHGSAGGKKEGGKINGLADLAQICDADIYITGHTHLPASFRSGFYRPHATNSSAAYVDKLFVNTAAWMDYGAYADLAGFKPASKINPVIYLDGTKKLARALV